MNTHTLQVFIMYSTDVGIMALAPPSSFMCAHFHKFWKNPNNALMKSSKQNAYINYKKNDRVFDTTWRDTLHIYKW